MVTALTDHIEAAEERLDNLETMARWLWLTVIFELALIVVVMLGTHL